MSNHQSDLSTPTTHRSTSTATRLLGVLGGLTLALLMTTTTGANASSHLFDRGIAQACTAYAQGLERFPDVAADGAHAAAIDCLAHREIVLGRDDGSYAPGDDVTRATMATYLANTLDRLPGVELPAPSTASFPDYTSGTHHENVQILRAAGIVEGRGDGTYGPSEPVTRAAMATYIAQTLEFVIDEELPVSTSPAFPDVDGVHQNNVDKLAAIGVVTGRGDGTYGPNEPVTRAAMASFIARAQDYLAVRGYLPVAFEIDVDMSADPAPANLNQRIAGQVNDQFDLGYFSAEVRFEVYRDDQLVLTASRTSGLGGDVEFSYNADADEGDTDRVVSCIVDADEQASDGVPFCLGGDDLEPVDGRRVTELTFDWGELAVASAAAAEGEFVGMALRIDPDNTLLDYQTLPTPDAPLGDFLFFDYVGEANFQVNGETNVATAVFECAVQASIADERNTHLLHISLDPDGWNTYDLSTGTDVSGCF